MSKSDQQAIARYFEHQPVLYIGGLGHVFSLQAGILLSQLLYWNGHGARADGFIYKPADEIRAELGMSRSNQETAIKQLIKHGVIEYKLAQVPARKHFKVDMARLHELLPSLKETSKLTYPNPPRYYVKNQQTITKITRKTTTKNTIQKIDKNNFGLERKRLIGLKTAKPP